MKKKTKRLFFLAGAAGCTMAAAIWLLPGTSAYFTDHESVWNRMVFGHNTSTIDEEFPTPTPNFGVFYRSRECLESYGVRT